MRCQFQAFQIRPQKLYLFHHYQSGALRGYVAKNRTFWSQNTILTVFLNRISFHIFDRKCIKIFTLELYESGISASE